MVVMVVGCTYAPRNFTPFSPCNKYILKPLSVSNVTACNIREFRSLSCQFNALVSSFIKNDMPGEAIRLYADARWCGGAGAVDIFAVPTILKACGKISSIQIGKEVHGFAMKLGYECDVFVHNAALQMYSECGSLEEAEKVFGEIPYRDVVSWSTMIRSYTVCRCHDQAMQLVMEMLHHGIRPSAVAIINILNLCADIESLCMGRAMHTYTIKTIMATGTLSSCANASTALVDMYVKCGCTRSARRVFDGMNYQRSIVSWTAMIAGYIRSRDLGGAMDLFRRMQQEKVAPNEITLLSLSVECGRIGALMFGKWLHAYALRNGIHLSLALATALMDMYAKCGDLHSAIQLFEGINERDVMSWSGVISCYTRANLIDRAFQVFNQMREVTMEPNTATMANLVTLCANAGALDRGRWLHSLIEKQMLAQDDVVLSTCLVDMYAKCGDIDAARAMFSASTCCKDVCMWNALLNGLAMHGHGHEAIKLFSEMERSKIRPNDITIVGLLHACSHSGMLEQGKQFFARMECDFGLVPKVEHYGCMVDLLGRAGRLNEAHEVVKNMPVEPNVVVWGALLAACKLHKNDKLSEVASREVLKLEPDNGGYSVLLSNIYAARGRWDDVAEVRRSIREGGITNKKSPGISCIELDGLVHEFVMGDERHPRNPEIQAMADEMQRELRQAGHVAVVSAALLNVDKEEKEAALSRHSERLAMALGLISTAAGITLRIVKNLRVCDDCHAATKLLSKIYGREIVMRDRKRFHRFTEGSCSCGEYW